MIKCRLTLTGVEEAIEGADLAEKLLLQYVSEALDWFGRIVSEEAKADHPYEDRTGELTKSIGYTVESWRGNHVQVNVYSLAVYADEIEFGTARSRAYPFIFPRFYAHIEELQTKVKEAVNRALVEGGQHADAA